MKLRIVDRIGMTVVALSLVLLTGADWTRFRGPDASGVSDRTGLPTTWSETENVVWKTALPGFGASSPIVLEDKVFVTGYSGYGLDRDEPGQQEELLHHVTCIDRTSGEILWNARGRAKLPETEYRRFICLHGFASATPVTDGQALFAFFGKSGVWAYSLDGRLLWRVSVGNELDSRGWGSGASPILAGDLLIVNASIESQSLVALDKASGKEVWRAGGIKDSWSTPLLVDLPDGKQELVVSLREKVRGYDPVTGEQLWECAGVRDYVCPAVIAHQGVVYVSGGRSPQTLAIKAGGRGDVSNTHTLWEISKASKVPSPLYHQGLLYWVDSKGFARCVDADSGEQLYQHRLGFSGAGDDKIYASVVLADGKLYAVSRQGGTAVYAPGKDYQELARNDLADPSVFNATPAIADGQLLLRSDKFLYCIGK